MNCMVVEKGHRSHTEYATVVMKSCYGNINATAAAVIYVNAAAAM